ncbi:hypothetical protein E0198_004395 [Clavispora lusitaniae]|nr:hypothetical protein E0198_004395 [Clavispora lusitaniae]
MSIHSTTSLESEKIQDSDFVPQPLADSSSCRSLHLSRNPTNVSELSRIITAIRDDHLLDNEEFEEYRDRLPEQTLVEQLDSKQAETHIESETLKEDHPIDGPFAFWQAFLVMLMMFSTWGVNAAFGVFLNYYLNSNAFPSATMYDYALMGGVIVFLAQFLAPLTVLAVKTVGQTPVNLLGITIQTLAYMLASVSTKFWEVFVCQGVMVGLSFAMIFIPGTLILPTWFRKQKSTAMGIAVAGGGLGGVVFALSLNRVIEETGNQKWALRMVGIISFCVSCFAAAFMRPRNPQKIPYRANLTKANILSNIKTILDISTFKEYPIALLALWFGIILIGYILVLYSFSNYAVSVGLTHTQASNLLAILNGAQVVGRPTVGQLGDIFGRYNTASFFCAYVAVLLFAFWLNASSYASLIVLAVLLGGPVGLGSTMAQSLALDSLELLDKPGQLPAVWSILNIVVGLFSLPAEVIGLKLKKGNGPKSYRNAQIFTGCCFTACLLIGLINREWAVRLTFIKRRRQTLEHLNTILNSENFSEDDEKSEECILLQARLDRYDQLLKNGPICFFLRLFYPLRV